MTHSKSWALSQTASTGSRQRISKAYTSTSGGNAHGSGASSPRRS